MLRDIAEGIAEYIEGDEFLRERGRVSVVVEDKANFSYEIQQALGGVGVCVTIAVVEFRRVERSPVPQGTLRFEISCYEHPTLNREDMGTLTAQGVMERLYAILHYRRFPFLANQLIFQSFRRDDIAEANIVRGELEANTVLGFEDKWAKARAIGNN